MSQVLEWIKTEWHRVVIFLLALDHLYDRLYPIFEKYEWAEKSMEHRWHIRREPMNVLTLLTEGPAVLTDLLTAVSKIQADLPQFQKTAADLKQAASDKSDPVKLSTDISVLLSDLQADMADLAALIPTTKPPQAAS
jgi:hypothetical protein